MIEFFTNFPAEFCHTIFTSRPIWYIEVYEEINKAFFFVKMQFGPYRHTCHGSIVPDLNFIVQKQKKKKKERKRKERNDDDENKYILREWGSLQATI